MEITENLNFVIKENDFSSDDEPPSSLSATISKPINIQSKVHDYLNHDSNSNEVISASEKSLLFMQKHFPGATLNDWNNWHWQIRNSIRSHKQLSNFFTLSDEEKRIGDENKDSLPVRITPYYASLIDSEKPMQSIRRSIVPVYDEFLISKGEASDPLSENHDSPVSNIVHRYPDRALFLVTGYCAAYCRYCTRSHMVAKDSKSHLGVNEWELGFDYLRKHPEVRDVIISGGDPLTMSDDKIEFLLSNLRNIPSIEIIRIGTKVPVVIPQRITKNLVEIFKKYHPLYLSIHFTHPDEITSEVKEACERIAFAGVPMGSQTVLLKNINDSVEVMKSLVHNLLKIRVRPYYLYQCDPILGSAHFRTPVSKGIEIIKGLRGHTSGYAIPHYVIDAPGGGGKIPILPEYYQGKEGDEIILKNYQDKIFRYPDYID